MSNKRRDWLSEMMCIACDLLIRDFLMAIPLWLRLMQVYSVKRRHRFRNIAKM